MATEKNRVKYISLITLCATNLYAAGVGKLPLSTSVTGQGQVQISVPIKLPMGTNNITPSVSLNYMSSPAKGNMGVGWSLSGVSSISRCAKEKVLDDNYDNSLVFQKTDKLCLDGVRLLSGGKDVNKTANSQLDVVTVYTTELQSYKKIISTIDTSTSQPLSFTVTTKDGTTMTYGNSVDSKVVVNIYYPNVGSPTTSTLAWMLTDIIDINGNKIHYQYSVDTTNNTSVLSQISYTANSTTTPIIQAQNFVDFDYIADNTSPYTYIAGAQVKSNKILQTVRVSSLVNGSKTEVRRYNLGYRTTASKLTRRPLLESIEQCDSYANTQSCLPKTTFQWADDYLNFNTKITGPAWADKQDKTSASLDQANKDNIVAGSVDTWNGDLSYFMTIQYGDIDGDGKTDVCGRDSNGLSCYRSTGLGFSSTAITLNQFSNANGWSDESYYSTIKLVDINSDSKADVCARSSAGLVCYLSTGSSFNTTPVTLTSDFTDAGGWGNKTTKPYYTIRYMDLNQDGLIDVCGVGSNGLRCYYTNLTNNVVSFSSADLYNNQGSAWSISNVLPPNYKIPTIHPLILNKANATSLCITYTKDEDGKVVGNGTFRCLVVSPKNSTISTVYVDSYLASISSAYSARFTDVNGDGAMDVCNGSIMGYVCIKNPDIGVDYLTTYFHDLLLNLVSQTASSIFPSHFWENVTGFASLSRYANQNTEKLPDATRKIYLTSLQYIDINNDGLTDICQLTDRGFVCRMQERTFGVTLCKQGAPIKFSGSSSLTADQVNTICTQDTSSTTPFFQTADGYQDIFKNTVTLDSWTEKNGWYNPQQFMTIGLADVNGDGRIDVCGRESTGLVCYASSTTPSDRINQITDGFGLQTQITYKPLTDSSVYTKASKAVFPDMDIQPAMWVVANLKTSDGIGGFNNTDYTYAGLKINMDRGGLGFSSMEVRDQTTGILVSTSYQQVFPYIGLVSQVDQKNCASSLVASKDCTLLKSTITTWNKVDVLPAPYTGTLPYPTQSIQQFWEMPTNP